MDAIAEQWYVDRDRGTVEGPYRLSSIAHWLDTGLMDWDVMVLKGEGRGEWAMARHTDELRDLTNRPPPAERPDGQRRRPQSPRVRHGEGPSVALAVILSLLWPGVGYFVCGKTQLGLVGAIAWPLVALVLGVATGGLFWFVCPFVLIAMAVDAGMTASVMHYREVGEWEMFPR